MATVSIELFHDLEHTDFTDSIPWLVRAMCRKVPWRRKRKVPTLADPCYSQTAILFLISAMALPGFKPLGQVREQLRMV